MEAVSLVCIFAWTRASVHMWNMYFLKSKEQGVMIIPVPFIRVHVLRGQKIPIFFRSQIHILKLQDVILMVNI